MTMNDNQGHNKQDVVRRRKLYRALVGVLALLVVVVFAWLWYQNSSVVNTNPQAEEMVVDTTRIHNAIVNGKDLTSGLIAQGDYELVRNTCTACHSSSLILQAHFSRQTWIEKIRWMQANQKLWDLGSTEKPILDYLEKFYGPDSASVALRRPPLKNIEWYTLD